MVYRTYFKAYFAKISHCALCYISLLWTCNFLNQSCNIEASEIYVHYSSIIDVHRRLEMYHLHSNHEQILLKNLIGSQYYHCHFMQNIFCYAKAEDWKEKMIKPTWTTGSNPLLIIFITCNDNLVFSTH